jgi:hypothetical protein
MVFVKANMSCCFQGVLNITNGSRVGSRVAGRARNSACHNKAVARLESLSIFFIFVSEDESLILESFSSIITFTLNASSSNGQNNNTNLIIRSHAATVAPLPQSNAKDQRPARVDIGQLNDGMTLIRDASQPGLARFAASHRHNHFCIVRHRDVQDHVHDPSDGIRVQGAPTENHTSCGTGWKRARPPDGRAWPPDTSTAHGLGRHITETSKWTLQIS